MKEYVRLLIAFFAVAFTGGAAKALLYRKPGWRWFDICAQAFASGFTGFLVGTIALRWLGQAYTDVVLVLAGLSGWIGPALMDYAATVAFGLFRSVVDRYRGGDAEAVALKE